MIERKYSKDATHATQTLTTIIQAKKEAVFHYLATTEGISSWFPQLSIADEASEKSIVFDLGDGAVEKMALYDYITNEHIAFEWATGKVEFHLEETNEGTKLILTETMPLNFTAIVPDFTGWFIQMTNVKSVVETGQAAKIDKEEIQRIQSEVKAAY